MMKRRVVIAFCLVALMVQKANAQTSSSLPRQQPGSATIVVKPKTPPAQRPANPCIPGAPCTPPAPSIPAARPGAGDHGGNGGRDDRGRDDRRGDAPVRVPPGREPPAVPEPADANVPTDADPNAPAPDIPPDTNTNAPQGALNTQAPTAPTAPVAAGVVRELLVAAAQVAESEDQRRWFAQQGIGVLRRRALPNLGWVLTVYAIAPQVDLPTLVAALTAQWPNAAPEENRPYTPLSESVMGSDINYAASLVALPTAGCARRVRVAMLDGPINLALTVLSGRRVRTIDIADRSREPQFAHATGIAALLLGARDLPGLLPNVELFAANVFATQRGRSYTTTEWILRGLDWVLAQDPVPAVVNLSFGGPESEQLARAIRQVQQRARVVAAAGNAGRTVPVYPAAYSGVVAVAAVDARGRRWPRSNSGDFVSIAAPGVDLWTVDGAGNGYYASGTSFAAVYVSAALALGSPTQSALSAWLQGHAEDLGPPGRDRMFGFGLLRAQGLCD